MADRDERSARQPLLEQSIKRFLVLLGQRRRCLIEEEPVRCVEQRARESEPLLLAAGQHLSPVLAPLEIGRERAQADGLQRLSDLSIAELGRVSRISHGAFERADGKYAFCGKKSSRAPFGIRTTPFQ